MLKIAGIHWPYFLTLLVLVMVAAYFELLPINIVSGMALTMLLGFALKFIGDSIPVFNTFGGGALLCILVPALIVFTGLMPESFATLADDFYNELGFSELVVTGLIVGSILGMDRKLLVNVGARFFAPIAAGVVTALGVGALIGQLTGFGAGKAMMLVVGPIMGGGMAAGAVPMSEIYASVTGGDAAQFLEQLAPAVVVGNMVCIVMAGVLNGLGKTIQKPWFNGEGRMLRRGDFSYSKASDVAPLALKDLGVGLTLTVGVYVVGQVIAGLVPDLHAYVWIIIVAAVLKIANIVPESMNLGAEQWYDFISSVWVPAVLVSISAGMIDFDTVIEVASNPAYMLIVVTTVLVAATAAGLVGWLVGFYFVESSISAGLGMADMGGSGDVAVLGASNRMGLMPFLQIASRLGGALMLILLSLLAPLFL
ncbi:2-hydroxycarboxylate transporter family protein [Brevibacterium yomogidense]